MVDFKRKPRVGDVVIYHVSHHDLFSERYKSENLDYFPGVPMAAIVTALQGDVVLLAVFIPGDSLTVARSEVKHGMGAGDWEYRDNELMSMPGEAIRRIGNY